MRNGTNLFINLKLLIMKLIFNTKYEAENSEVYKSNNFSRFYKNMDTQDYVIETVDYGTCLSHHDLIKLGKNISFN